MPGTTTLRTIGAFLAASALVLTCTGCDLDFKDTDPSTGAGLDVTVTRVLDGDTFTADDTGGEDLGRLRVLGIDAPEMARDESPGECHATEATDAAKRLLDDATVTIALDPTQGEEDRYGRLLVYVEVDGQAMLADGHARLYRQSTTLTRYDVYQKAERAAQRQDRGLWARCA